MKREFTLQLTSRPDVAVPPEVDGIYTCQSTAGCRGTFKLVWRSVVNWHSATHSIQVDEYVGHCDRCWSDTLYRDDGGGTGPAIIAPITIDLCSYCQTRPIIKDIK